MSNPVNVGDFQILKSTKTGNGLATRKAIDQHQFVLEYVGDCYPEPQPEK